MPDRVIVRFHVLLLASAFALSQAKGVILFGAGNSANLTDPGTGVPFDSVALVADNGGENEVGSAIHIGDGYMLTANHVSMDATFGTYVTFDGSTYYQRDLSYTPTQVAANVDMKVFKLTSTPTVSSASTYGGTSEQTAAATLIGWGIGRDPTVPINTLSVDWDPSLDKATIDKRWGLNVPRDVVNISYSSYNHDAIRTVLGSNTGTPSGLGADEAALTLIDSGSGLFQKIGGTWYLIGLGTTVDTNWVSTFGDDSVSSGGDGNYFVRISNYDGDIAALVPEPGSIALLFVGLGLLLRRSRH